MTPGTSYEAIHQTQTPTRSKKGTKDKKQEATNQMGQTDRERNQGSDTNKVILSDLRSKGDPTKTNRKDWAATC
jgi:hypothetical protein